MSTARHLPLLAAALLSGSAAAQAGPANDFADWPAGTAPADVGRRLAENFLPRAFRCDTVPEKAHLGVIYPEACAWYGALTVAQLVGDTNLAARLVGKFDRFLTDEGARKINRSAHVDFRVVGIVPLEIFLQTRDARCAAVGLGLADAQWEKTTPDGITAEARYWIDDMYMLPVLQAQAFRATGDGKYLDRAALAMAAYFDRLQQPNGLFFHGTNAPFFWGRGNGWMAAGSAELLRSLPEQHPRRERILTGYRKMMAALLAAQDERGLWHQLVDRPDSWPETSGSAMFAFAFVTGVKAGWLDRAAYGPAARRAWLALVAQLDPDGNLRDVCVGTNKGDREPYYNDRPRVTGDLHGQAPMLWTASALLR